MTDPASSAKQISQADNDLSVTACDSTLALMCDPVNTTDHASETENLIDNDLDQNGMYPVLTLSLYIVNLYLSCTVFCIKLVSTF